MENLSRKEKQASLRKRLEPLLATTLSNNEVARRAQTSATSVARIRRQRGITLDVVKGGDGKDYAVAGREARALLEITRHLQAAREMMVSTRATGQIRHLLEEIALIAFASPSQTEVTRQ